MPISLGKVLSSMSCDQRTLLSKTHPAEMGVWDRSAPHTHTPCFLLSAFHLPIFGHPFILIFLCVDGGERDISIEANGNKCG